MEPLKPLFLKTYGKQRRKLSAWISPNDRKQAFDSTISSDDTSIFQHPKPKRTREKKTSVARGRAFRPAKRKAMLCLRESSSDEENIRKPSPPPPRLTQQRMTTRKSRLVSVQGDLMRQKCQQVFVTSECDEDTSATKPHRSSFKMKTRSNVHPPSTGRFVTHRRRAAAVKPKLPKAIVSILSSSDDFSSGAFRSCRISRPSRRRRVPPAFGVSSAENSLNAAGTSSVATNPFREISLNESADHSLGSCLRKPIFCSTPSAGSLSKHAHLKPFPISDQSSTFPSMSVSCVGVLSTFQKQTVFPMRSASLTGLHSEEKLQPSLGELQREPYSDHHEEPTVDLSKEPKRSRYRDLLSTDSGSSSHFVTAAGGLEWLIEVLKEKCLTERCTVQLERLDYFTVTQLCSQMTFSSCLEQSGSVHSQQSNDQLMSVGSGQTVDLSQSLDASFSLNLSVTNNKTSDYLQSVNSFEQAASVSNTDSANISSLVDCNQSVLYADHHTNSSFEVAMGTQLPASSTVQTLFTEEDALAAQEKCLTKKCSIMVTKMAVQKIKGFTQHKEASLACNGKYENDHGHIMDSSEDMTCSGETAAVLKTMLKEKCVTDKLTVEIKKITLLPKDATFKAPTDVSDSASDDQTKTDHQPECDCNEDTSSMKVSIKNQGSTSSEDTSTSDKEVAKKSCDIVPKRKKMSLAPKERKRRSTSTDRPGTMRKACVSGMSVSRWKNKGSTSTHVFKSRTAQTGRTKAVDCSINELISTQRKQPTELLGATMNFSTPIRASRHNLSSLLADFTPNTHTWSRLKAALSVHRKSRVRLTPRSSLCSSPPRIALADISQDLFATPLRTPLPKRLQSQLLSTHSLVVSEDDLSDAEKVYAECGQQHPLPWEECILPHRMKQCVKIGEGTFGEVFSTTSASGDTVALKIIPVEGSEKVNGEDQKTLGEVLHEIIISKELSSLKEKQQNQTHSFIGLNDLHCVQGCYPPDFLNAWDTFDQRKGSENDRPDFFEKDQLFIILEFEFGGIDLENSNGTLASLGVAKSILHQVTAALAVAEQELHFEHRDLHWGNVLVKTTRQKTGSFLLNGTVHSLKTKGVLVRIIDYSLSRLEIDDLTVSCDISNDEELFMGQGDYQFDIYRLMRQENRNNWSNYHPHTNVLWLHYLCSKLLSMKYRGSGGRGAKDMRTELTRFYDNVLQYSSAMEALQNCPMFQ